jgi:hypothetical protein
LETLSTQKSRGSVIFALFRDFWRAKNASKNNLDKTPKQERAV